MDPTFRHTLERVHSCLGLIRLLCFLFSGTIAEYVSDPKFCPSAWVEGETAGRYSHCSTRWARCTVHQLGATAYYYRRLVLQHSVERRL